MEQPVSRELLGEPIRELDLRPGDLLYIPRGYTHEALTTDGASLHLTLAILVVRWAELLRNAVAGVVEREVRLREAIPAGALDADETLAAMQGHFQELLKLVVTEARFEDAIKPLGQRYSQVLSMPLDGHFVSLNRLREIHLPDRLTQQLARNGLLHVLHGKRHGLWVDLPVLGAFNLQDQYVMGIVVRQNRLAAGWGQKQVNSDRMTQFLLQGRAKSRDRLPSALQTADLDGVTFVVGLVDKTEIRRSLRGSRNGFVLLTGLAVPCEQHKGIRGTGIEHRDNRVHISDRNDIRIITGGSARNDAGFTLPDLVEEGRHPERLEQSFQGPLLPASRSSIGVIQQATHPHPGPSWRTLG
ncbi:hypothetical protein CCP4SC76_8080001 [Gammaproteobacteria bacterium]